jgi:hypothetical protein
MTRHCHSQHTVVHNRADIRVGSRRSGGGGSTSGPSFPRPRSPHPLLPSFCSGGEDRWLPTLDQPHDSRATASAHSFFIFSKETHP